MSTKVLSRLSALFAFVAVVAVPLSAYAKGFVPLKIKYEATFAPPQLVTFEPLVLEVVDQIAGNGTHLGSFTGSYPHLVNFDAGTFAGTATLSAANGDDLSIELGGTGTPTGPTTFDVTFQGTITGGTGRFSEAQGSVSGTGTVDLAARKVKARLVGMIDKPNLPHTED